MICTKPGCGGTMVKKTEAAQGVWHCPKCFRVVFIVIIKDDTNGD